MKVSISVFARPPEVVAKDLIGRKINRRKKDNLFIAEIIETGAYKGDALRSQEGIFYSPGLVYIHIGQGGYRTLAIGTEKEGIPSVVTVRQALTLEGFKGRNKLIDGPGKLTNALYIDDNFDGMTIAGDDLWLEGNPVVPSLIRYISPADVTMSSNCLGYYRLKI